MYPISWCCIGICDGLLSLNGDIVSIRPWRWAIPSYKFAGSSFLFFGAANYTCYYFDIWLTGSIATLPTLCGLKLTPWDAPYAFLFGLYTELDRPAVFGLDLLGLFDFKIDAGWDPYCTYPGVLGWSGNSPCLGLSWPNLWVADCILFFETLLFFLDA